jgi:hypothetical protein
VVEVDVEVEWEIVDVRLEDAVLEKDLVEDADVEDVEDFVEEWVNDTDLDSELDDVVVPVKVSVAVCD